MTSPTSLTRNLLLSRSPYNSQGAGKINAQPAPSAADRKAAGLAILTLLEETTTYAMGSAPLQERVAKIESTIEHLEKKAANDPNLPSSIKKAAFISLAMLRKLKAELTKGQGMGS